MAYVKISIPQRFLCTSSRDAPVKRMDSQSWHLGSLKDPSEFVKPVVNEKAKFKPECNLKMVGDLLVTALIKDRS